MGAFGEKLRRQREQRGIALDAISNTTKISARMLRAIEEEHFDQLPGGVFNKGFVRAYARQVGLDEEEAVSDYLMALRESQIESQKILPDFHNPNHTPFDVTVAEPPAQNRPMPPANGLRREQRFPSEPHLSHVVEGNGRKSGHDSERSDRRQKDRRVQVQERGARDEDFGRRTAPPPETPLSKEVPLFAPDHSSTRVPWGKLAAALLVVCFAVAVWNLRRQNQTTAAATPSAPANQASAAPSTAPVIVSSQQIPVVHASPKSAATSISDRSSSTSVTALRAEPVSTTTASRATTSSKEPSERISTNGPAVKAAMKTREPKAPATFKLLIRAEKTTWIAVTADGKPVAQETLIAPAETSVRASQEVVVRTSNAAGISFVLNAKEIPPQGRDGEVRTFIFDGAGIRASASQTPNSAR